jgi:hypothetical protein
MAARSTQDSKAQNTTEEQDGVRQREVYAARNRARNLTVDHPDYCIGSGPTSHVLGYFNQKVW